MTACAADDHLDLFITVSVSDEGIEEAKIIEIHPDSCHEVKKCDTRRREGVQSCSIHLWDAEMMSLVGTLLFPDISLTKNLASIAAGLGASWAPVDNPAQPGRQRDETDSAFHATDEIAAAKTASAVDAAQPSASGVLQAPTHAPRVTPATLRTEPVSVKTGCDPSRPMLVTALAFLSPYPLVVGASTKGALAVWRVSDCVCVKVKLAGRGITIKFIHFLLVVNIRGREVGCVK